MLKMQYADETTYHDIEFSQFGHVVTLTGDIPENNAGFYIYRQNGLLIGDYTDYTTVYRSLEGGLQYSNDGTVYVPPTPPEPHIPNLQEIQISKRQEVAAACEQIIYKGVTVTLADGTVEHFSLTEHDQLNLFGKQMQVSAGQGLIEYHADGQPCRYYSHADMQAIIQSAMWHVSYHTTYCNALNMWIEGCQDAEEAQTIFYGADVPEAYQSAVLKEYLTKIAALAGGES